MSPKKYSIICFIFFNVALCFATPLYDSLPLEGHFSQAGQYFSRGEVEHFLLDQDTSAYIVDGSMGFKWSGHAIGAALWCITLGYSAYQLNQVYEAVRTNHPLTTNFYKFSMPLLIGSEVASFVQARLYNRSEYLLHVGARAYNLHLANKFKNDSLKKWDIVKGEWGSFSQCRLGLTEPVLYGVLQEQPASYPYATWSIILRETASQLGSWGGMYVFYAALAYIEENNGEIIDKKARDNNLTIGVSLVSGAIVSAIISYVCKNVGVDTYNKAINNPVNVNTVPVQKDTPQTIQPAH